MEWQVTGTRISSEGMDARRRRLKFRSWHRGMREMDLVLGRFADAELGDGFGSVEARFGAKCVRSDAYGLLVTWGEGAQSV